jgi:hypothetical protein
MGRAIEVVGKSTLTAVPTPGMDRHDGEVSPNVRAIHVRTEPGIVSGWHHHGRYTTYGAVLSGRLRFEFGSGGEDTSAAPATSSFRQADSSRRDLARGTSPRRFPIGKKAVVNVDGPEEG